MKNTIIFLFALAFFAGCKPDSSKSDTRQATDNHASPVLLAGYWIAMDFCARANEYGSVLSAMNYAHIPYAYAFEFDPNKPDSVICYNGFEAWTLPVVYKKDTLEVKGASQGKSVFLMYDSKGTKEMSLFDGTQGAMKMDRFVKSMVDVQDGYSAFQTALNYNLFGGIMLPLGKGGAARDTVMFAPDGFILKWGEYSKYEVCTGGDCFVGEEAIDIVTLSKHDKPGSEKMFGFRYNGTNDTLTLYNLANTRPDEKYAYEIKGPAYRFRHVAPK